jgi:hypothetical protein
MNGIADYILFSIIHVAVPSLRTYCSYVTKEGDSASVLVAIIQQNINMGV